MARLSRLSFERLQPLLYVVAQVTRLRDEVVQNSSVLLVGVLICTVQRAVMQVANARYVRAVRGNGILDRRDLQRTGNVSQSWPKGTLQYNTMRTSA